MRGPSLNDNSTSGESSQRWRASTMGVEVTLQNSRSATEAISRNRAPWSENKKAQTWRCSGHGGRSTLERGIRDDCFNRKLYVDVESLPRCAARWQPAKVHRSAVSIFLLHLPKDWSNRTGFRRLLRRPPNFLHGLPKVLIGSSETMIWFAFLLLSDRR